MARVQVSVTSHIDAPVERVWALVDDLDRLHEWHEKVVAVRDISPTRGVGMTAILTILVPPGSPRDFRAEVVAVEPPRFVRMAGHEIGGAQSWISTYRLSEAGGGTDFRWDQETEIPGGRLVGGLADKLFLHRHIEGFMRTSLATFAGLVAESLQPV